VSNSNFKAVLTRSTTKIEKTAQRDKRAGVAGRQWLFRLVKGKSPREKTKGNVVILKRNHSKKNSRMKRYVVREAHFPMSESKREQKQNPAFFESKNTSDKGSKKRIEDLGSVFLRERNQNRERVQ